jgi:transcriptional antiterminator NusG
MTKRWYAVLASAGYEKIVQKGLRERIELSSLLDMFGEVLVPVEEVVEMKAGQKNFK